MRAAFHRSRIPTVELWLALGLRVSLTKPESVERLGLTHRQAPGLASGDDNPDGLELFRKRVIS